VTESQATCHDRSSHCGRMIIAAECWGVLSGHVIGSDSDVMTGINHAMGEARGYPSFVSLTPPPIVYTQPRATIRVVWVPGQKKKSKTRPVRVVVGPCAGG
jgi:hypothetical protein